MTRLRTTRASAKRQEPARELRLFTEASPVASGSGRERARTASDATPPGVLEENLFKEAISP